MDDYPDVDGQKVMFQAETTVDHWSAPARMLCDQTWQGIPQAHDRPVEEGEGAAPQGASECCIPLGPQVVGLFPSYLEWSMFYGRCSSEKATGYSDFRCLRELRVRGVHVHWGVVPVGINGGLEWGTHYREGAPAYRARGGHVGAQMEGSHSAMPL